ncbi:MAG: hypothetical protein LBJ17_07940, partial [Dysgonamonadaceae bacterium]|nr:hypothetical protein [Dysgonamonadaceae bacterium]
NKVYSRLHSNQLERYREIFKEHYKDTDFSLNYVYFTCHDDLGEDEKCCLENGFRPYTMNMVYDKAFENENMELTGNSLFDEFWLSNWG